MRHSPITINGTPNDYSTLAAGMRPPVPPYDGACRSHAEMGAEHQDRGYGTVLYWESKPFCRYPSNIHAPSAHRDRIRGSCSMMRNSIKTSISSRFRRQTELR